MPQSSLHVAIILDGNGRWATARGLPRTAGHRAGVCAVERIVPAALGLGIGTLTLHAFSTLNWQRPPGEVANLMRLFTRYFRSEPAALAREGIRLSVLGRRDRLPEHLARVIERACARTGFGSALDLRIAIDYSAREDLLSGNGTESPDVDLLIRTGGERRLSDFLLFEAAHAELLFLEKHWPDFGPRDLEAALAEFRSRDRRFGRVAQEGLRRALPSRTCRAEEQSG